MRLRLAMAVLATVAAGLLLVRWTSSTSPRETALAAITNSNYSRPSPAPPAERDLAKGMEMAVQLKRDAGRDEAVREILGPWFSSAPADARRWVENYLAANLADATAQSSNPADDRDRDSVLITMAGAWAVKDPRAAMDWVKNQPPSHHRLLALETIFDAWAKTDRAQAAAALPELSEPSLRSRLVPRFASQWTKAENDLPGAMTWALSAVDTADRETTIRAVVNLWSGENSATVGGWLNTLPAGPVKDSAVAAFARQITPRDPKAAVAWASTISNPALRGDVVENVAISWVERDPASARQTLSAMELPEPLRKRLFKSR